MSLDFIFSILILIFSVVIHEVAHGYTAYMQGDNTAFHQGRLTLFLPAYNFVFLRWIYNRLGKACSVQSLQSSQPTLGRSHRSCCRSTFKHIYRTFLWPASPVWRFGAVRFGLCVHSHDHSFYKSNFSHIQSYPRTTSRWFKNTFFNSSLPHE